MSCKESPHAGVSTTTISSVAVQAGNSKIVIALVKVSAQLSFLCVAVAERGSSLCVLRVLKDNAHVHRTQHRTDTK